MRPKNWVLGDYATVLIFPKVSYSLMHSTFSVIFSWHASRLALLASFVFLICGLNESYKKVCRLVARSRQAWCNLNCNVVIYIHPWFMAGHLVGVPARFASITSCHNYLVRRGTCRLNCGLGTSLLKDVWLRDVVFNVDVIRHQRFRKVMLPNILVWFFFPKRGHPQPLHRLMYAAFYCFTKVSKVRILHQRSHKVDTWINQIKKEDMEWHCINMKFFDQNANCTCSNKYCATCSSHLCLVTKAARFSIFLRRVCALI